MKLARRVSMVLAVSCVSVPFSPAQQGANEERVKRLLRLAWAGAGADVLKGVAADLICGPAAGRRLGAGGGTSLRCLCDRKLCTRSVARQGWVMPCAQPVSEVSAVLRERVPARARSMDLGGWFGVGELWRLRWRTTSGARVV
jgi:hypothetical protein